MTFQELPAEVQERLTKDRQALAGKIRNDAYTIHIYDAAGKRYLYARRCCKAWGEVRNNHACSMPFGGGTYWTIKYGAVQFTRRRNPLGIMDYELCDGKTYCKSANGTSIPTQVETKKEVIDIIKRIGIFNF